MISCFAKRVATLLVFLSSLSMITSSLAEGFNVRAHGAKGDGTTIDTPAINKAVEAAAAAGGGTVVFPAGTYLSYSIRLKSNVTLHLEPGSTLLAAAPDEKVGYDPAEPNEWGDKRYQDFGHSHWHNSLIWGENLENIAITGSGLIDGQGLSRGERSIGSSLAGNKAIALKNCRNVTLRDFSMLRAGWFALLATGVDNFTIDNVRVDTNRDGFDIDACRNVRISNCHVNSLSDDAIVLKSSYALGELRACENITINGCEVSGFDPGSFLDGTYKRTVERAPDRDGPTGRIKFGTESNGGFKNIAISNCVFVRSRGIAIETVDGGLIEDVSITNITMRDVSNSPVFLRLGARLRGPEGTKVGAIRRVSISHVIVSNCDPRYPILVAGLPGFPIEDLRLSDIRVVFRGGITMEQVKQQPTDLVNTFFLRGPGLTGPRDPFNPPENENGYPEPSMFGILPASGLFIRHASNVKIDDVELSYEKPDERPVVVLMDVAGITFSGFKVPLTQGKPTFVLKGVSDFEVRDSRPIPSTLREKVENESL